MPPALPPALRAWLAARNPLFVPYVGWSAGFSFLTLANLVVWLTGNWPNGPADIVRLAAIASLPTAYREQFAELRTIVAALEALAAGARAEVDVVAALEGIRLDLL